MPIFHDMQREHDRIAQFLFVYIQEAHATDEWPISSSRFNGDRGIVSITQAKTIEHRVQAMQAFQRDFQLQMPVLAADIEGVFEEAFKPWPIRVLVFDTANYTVLSAGKVKDCAPDLTEVQRALC